MYKTAVHIFHFLATLIVLKNVKTFCYTKEAFSIYLHVTFVRKPFKKPIT